LRQCRTCPAAGKWRRKEQQAEPQEAATAEGTIPSEQGMLKTTEAPSALGLLKDWSTWLVGLQTGALALVSFIAGKDGFVTFTRRAARAMLYLAIVSFAGSVITATFVLGAIPTIRMRLGNENELNDLWDTFQGDWWCPSLPADTPDANFYCMRAFDGLPVPLIVFTFLEHWLFILGIVFFGVAIFLELWKRGSEANRESEASPTSD